MSISFPPPMPGHSLSTTVFSAIVSGQVSAVSSFLQTHSMPLNIQISFGYSRFLDNHVYNFLQKSPVNRITTSLAYKPLAKFDYVSFSSNIAPLYKGKYITPSMHF